MSDTRFAPGPWSAPVDTDNEYPWVTCAPGTVVAKVFAGYEDDDVPYEDRLSANAHLIAAAPELYQRVEKLERAIHSALNRLGGPWPDAEWAHDILRTALHDDRTALAKARGES